jgi:hypothetical protein
MPQNGCFLLTIFRGRVKDNLTVRQFLPVMKAFIVLNWGSVMGANGDIRVLALANALNGQEAWEIKKTDDKTYLEIDSGMGWS